MQNMLILSFFFFFFVYIIIAFHCVDVDVDVFFFFNVYSLILFFDFSIVLSIKIVMHYLRSSIKSINKKKPTCVIDEKLKNSKTAIIFF